MAGLENKELDKRGALLGQIIHDAWNPAITTKKYFENTLEVLTASLHLVLSFCPVEKNHYFIKSAQWLLRQGLLFLF